MAVTANDIKAPIEEELAKFEGLFEQTLKSDAFLLDKIMNYIVKRKGKQMRPMFVFLTAKLCGEVTEASYRGAALIELLHTATLVHDDVVDEANYRRGFFSLNALWNSKVAVLVGDYLLSKGLLLSVDNNDFDLLRHVSHAVREMSEGELLQIEKARRLDITEDVYFEVIRQKTASLIASCCAVGAASVGSTPEQVEKLRLFGEKVGMAFQIKDDLFDFGTDEVGKPLGIDIKERKMTLPLIYALSKCSWLKRKKMVMTVKYGADNPATVSEVIQFVKESGGLQYAEEVMHRYVAEAMAILEEFPDSPEKRSLEQIVRYTTERKK